MGFSIPTASIEYWVERLKEYGVAVGRPKRKFHSEIAVTFEDPDGLHLELVAGDEEDPRGGWVDGPIPEKHAIRGVYGVTLAESSVEPTHETLTLLGFERLASKEGSLYRYKVGRGGPGAVVDVEVDRELVRGRIGVGSVHHVAYRTGSDEEQLWWCDTLKHKKYKVTKVYNRLYFKSIYFRELGGTLFEIATDPPGFTVDEPEQELGTSLKLPPWLEQDRELIVGQLQPISVPTGWRRIP